MGPDFVIATHFVGFGSFLSVVGSRFVAFVAGVTPCVWQYPLNGGGGRVLLVVAMVASVPYLLVRALSCSNCCCNLLWTAKSVVRFSLIEVAVAALAEGV